MKTSEKYIIPVAVIYFVVIIFALVKYIYNDQSVKDNQQNGRAVIGYFSSDRNGYYFSYQFNIDEKKYKGTGTYYPDSDILSVGDTVDIVYDKTNPANNKSARDFYKKGLNPIYLFIIIPMITILIYFWKYKK